MKKHFDYLFLDFMVEDSHKVYCNALISAINEKYTSIVIEKQHYIDYDTNDLHRVINFKAKEIVGNYPIKARINTVYNFKEAIKNIQGYSFGKVIILGYDPVMFTFMYKRLKKMGELYLVQHHQLDEVNSSNWKLKLWNRYKQCVNHIVLDPSICEPICKKFRISENKINIFPHPCVMQDRNNITYSLSKTDINVLCISNSNDSEQIRKLIKNERESKFFESNGIKIYVRNKDGLEVSDLSAFKVIEGFLTKEEYNKLNEKCDIVLMPFPPNYRYRCSGTLIDALAAGKKVLSSNILEAFDYARKFPRICKTYKKIVEVGSMLLELSNTETDDDITQFLQYQNQIKEKGLEKICDQHRS